MYSQEEHVNFTGDESDLAMVKKWKPLDPVFWASDVREHHLLRPHWWNSQRCGQEHGGGYAD